MFESMLLAATVAVGNLSELSGKLPRGPHAAIGGAHCGLSATALGTSNVEGNGLDTTAVNIWIVRDERQHNAAVGYIVRARDGRLWYEDPVGFSYQPIDEGSAGILLHSPFA